MLLLEVLRDLRAHRRGALLLRGERTARRARQRIRVLRALREVAVELPRCHGEILDLKKHRRAGEHLRNQVVLLYCVFGVLGVG